MSEKKQNKDTRTRNWTIVVYPESAPENWRDILDDMHLEWIESPLHDGDINANGEFKKPHWHVLLMFGGVKTFEQVREVTEILNCPRPERCHNAKALVRYMVHMDNPEKKQYRVEDIKAHGGVDVREMLRPNSSERYTLVAEMIDFIDEYNITEFWAIVKYAKSQRFDDWFPLLADNSAFFVKEYIKSKRHGGDFQLFDEESGEMLI